MAIKKRGLGKGLDALLGQRTTTDLNSLQEDDRLQSLDVDLMQRGQYQPRSIMDKDALSELADSIKAQGVVQPILVRPLKGTKRYEIIAGERRWRAAQMAGLEQVPVVIRDVPDQTAMCMALIENIQREDLNPLEQANALARLLEEFGMTHEAVAEAVGRSRSTVTNLLRLLELEPDVKQLLVEKKLEMGHARALLSLTGLDQVAAARHVSKRGLSVRETEAYVRKLSTPRKQPAATRSDPNILRLQEDLSERLGSKVSIKQQGKGRGILQINYHSLDELQGILDHIK